VTAVTSTAPAEESVQDPTRRRARRRASRRNVGAALLFLSPWIIGFLVFTAWPLIYSVYLSLTDYDVINDPSFVGFDNYMTLFQDPKISLALGNTFIFTLLHVPLYVIVSLALALLLNRAGRSAGFFRTMFFLPKMTPPVAIGILFLLLFNGQNGLINTVLGWFGINGPAWTTDPAFVKPGLVIMSLWTVGASVLILLAALKGVPQELYESARIDGAGFWRQSMSVTLPMISPALFFIIVVNTIAALQTFDEAYTAFFGAGNSTYSNDAALFYTIYLFQQAFQFLHMGYAAAMAWILFFLIMIVTAVQLIVSRRLVYYEGEESR
jgi:multiple sugar transport system permease protein